MKSQVDTDPLVAGCKLYNSVGGIAVSGIPLTT